MMYATPVIKDFGSISSHTFTTPNGQIKNADQVPGHYDGMGILDCSGGSAEPQECNLPT
jgi:hypothetical protein